MMSNCCNHDTYFGMDDNIDFGGGNVRLGNPPDNPESSGNTKILKLPGSFNPKRSTGIDPGKMNSQNRKFMTVSKDIEMDPGEVETNTTEEDFFGMPKKYKWWFIGGLAAVSLGTILYVQTIKD